MKAKETVKKALATPLIAWAWASGLIELGTELPEGALPIALSTNKKALTDIVDVLARHGYRGELLVPGCPEAKDQNEARIALTRFRYLVEERLLTEVKNNG